MHNIDIKSRSWSFGHLGLLHHMRFSAIVYYRESGICGDVVYWRKPGTLGDVVYCRESGTCGDVMKF